MMPKLKLYAIYAGVAVALIGAIAVAINQRDARLRAEGAWIAESKAVIARADSALKIASDSATARSAREFIRRRQDSIAIKALADRLQQHKDSVASLTAVADSNQARADSLLAALKADSTAADSLTRMREVILERGRENMNVRGALAQSQAATRTAETSLARVSAQLAERDSTIARMGREKVTDLELISDLRDQLADPVMQPKRSLARTVLNVGRVLGEIGLFVLFVTR